MFTLGVIYSSSNSDSLNFEHLNVSPPCSIRKAFLTLLEYLYTFQHVHFLTRYRNNQVPSLLDLVLTNNEHMIPEITSQPPLGKSDHIVIEFEYLCYYTAQQHNVSQYLYDHGDYESMKHELLSTDWEQVFGSLDMQTIWSIFHSKMLLLIDKYIPSCIFRSNVKTKWLNLSTLKLIKRKHKARNTYKATWHQICTPNVEMLLSFP